MIIFFQGAPSCSMVFQKNCGTQTITIECFFHRLTIVFDGFQKFKTDGLRCLKYPFLYFDDFLQYVGVKILCLMAKKFFHGSCILGFKNWLLLMKSNRYDFNMLPSIMVFNNCPPQVKQFRPLFVPRMLIWTNVCPFFSYRVAQVRPIYIKRAEISTFHLGRGRI